MIVQKYVAALASIIIVVLSALIAIPSGTLNWTSALQLVAIGIAAILTYLSPLLNIQWRGILKTGAAILGAVVATALPIVNTLVAGQPFHPIYVALIVLAAVNALSVEVGVQIRTDTSAIIGADVPLVSSVNQNEPVPVDAVPPLGLQQLTSPPAAALFSTVNPANATEVISP